MFLNGDIDRDESQDESLPSRAWIITLAALCLPIYVPFALLGMKGRGTVACCSIMLFPLIVYMHPEFRKQPWFWVALCLFFCAFAALVMFIHWPNTDFTWPIMFPCGCVAYYLMSFGLRFLGKHFGQN